RAPSGMRAETSIRRSGSRRRCSTCPCASRSPKARSRTWTSWSTRSSSAEGNERLSSGSMHSRPRDVASIRLDNALALFDEFVRATVKDPDIATLRGLERRFAERLQIQPSYWSQIKSRSRQIGERLARQFEQLCHKPYGWIDQPHGALTPSIAAAEVPAEPAG